MSEFAFKSYLVGLALPAVASLLFVLLTIRWTADRPCFAHVVGFLTFAVGYFAFYDWLGIAPIKPVNSEHYIVYAAELALLVGMLQALTATPEWLNWRMRLMVAVISAVYLVPTWDDLLAARPWWILGLAAVILESWNALDALAKRIAGAALPIALTGITFAGSVVLFQSGSAKFAQLLTMASAILFGVSIISMWKSEQAVLKGMVPGIAVLIPAWMMTGKLYTFSTVPNWSFALIAAAPFVMSLAIIPLPKSISPRLQRWLVAAIAIAIAGVAVYLALSAESGAAEW